ncbi:MAG TPA: ABC transporter permease [Steroidobacteraceae bacterium]|jgi:putative ABC transport system permease protein|nr:ABC transporter permease [Steroidobacteraceae bacterium]
MNALRQILAVTAIGLRAIPQRLGPSLVVVVGMACVVAVSISILSMSTGFMRTIGSTGRADRAIVLSRNSQYEGASSITRDNVPVIADGPGIRKAADGKPIVSADYMAYVAVTKKSNGLDAYVDVRGMSPGGFALRPEIKLIDGRLFRPATHEVIVGKSAQTAFEGLEVGSKVTLPEGDWTVTGTFESGGSGFESEMLADAETVISGMRANAFNSMTVLLTTPEAFNQFKAALVSNPALAVDVLRENDYLAVQARDLNRFLTIVAYLVGGVMGLGALFGALNTLYSAVSTRSTEIATLRVFGFGAGAILFSILAEALLLSLLGAALGALLAWLAFNGNLHAAGSLVFRLTVTPLLMTQGIVFACALGLLGGLLPALRAARVPVAVALRDS